MKHVLSVKVNNTAGVLSHVTGLFTRRSYNIDSLCVGETNDPKYSVITLVINETPEMIQQITKQLLKLIDVKEIKDLTADVSIKRELLLVTVEIKKTEKADLIALSRLFEATIVEMATSTQAGKSVGSTVLIQLVAEPRRVANFIQAMADFKIVNMARTGVVALALP